MRRAAKVDLPGKYLGDLCLRGHDYEETGLSLRKESDRGCVVCCRERALERYHRDPGAYGIGRDPERRRRYEAEWRRKKRKTDPDLVRAYGRERYARERLMTRLRNRLRKAFNLARIGKTLPSNEYADFSAILAHIGPCPGPVGEWEIDHIRPLSSFDFSDIGQVRAAFSPKNHQWLTAEQNRRKHAKSSTH